MLKVGTPAAISVLFLGDGMERPHQKALVIHLVESTDSPEFTLLTRALPRSSVIGLDAEWKPTRSNQSDFPTVSLLQLACQFGPRIGDKSGEPVVFLLDLATIPLPSIWGLLRGVFVNPDVLKLGFRFKHDLVYLSSTFCAQGCEPGFDRVEPYLDITSLYCLLQHKMGKKISKDVKSLATICAETVGIFLSKELQCSDWSNRPLTEEQKAYAAKDAYCLLRIFEVFRSKVIKEGTAFCDDMELESDATLGLKEILDTPASGNRLLGTQFYDALDIIMATAASEEFEKIITGAWIYTSTQYRDTKPMEESLWKIVKKYGEKINLRESDRRRKNPKKKGKKRTSSFTVCEEKQLYNSTDWDGLPPWDSSLGGDGCPKFLCDVMVEGLAKHLRCVGIDAAIPCSKRPEPRELIDQAYKEKRVLLTRDAKLLRHQYLVKNQIYRIKSLLKNDQLLEVIETFQLKISEGQLMSRCSKCNGRFIQKPLTTEEAIEAAKGFQKIPDCLFDKNLEFWQCMDCGQLYWEGTQYHNAVQKFSDICRLNE